jgi:hypothetical protein
MADHRIDGIYLTPKRTAKLRFRQGILDSWGGCCAYCGEPAGTLDHVKPRARGGQSVLRNLVACCAQCNRDKGSVDWLLWFRQQSFWCGHREGRIDGWIGTRVEHAA